MKKGWTYKKLGEVATFMSGYTPGKDELFCQGDYPYFKVAEMNLVGNELFMKNTSLFVNNPKKVFPKSSIIFPKNGGAIYTEKKRILACDSVIDLNTEAIVPSGTIDLMYLYYLLTFTKISSFDKGGGLPSLDLKKMSEHIIPVPPLHEQQAIVSRLDAAFAQIDALKANAGKQLSEARKLFQKALEEAMKPKEGWEEKMLGELATDMYRGSGIKRDQVTKDGVPCVRYGEIYTTYNMAFEECVSHVHEELISSPKYFEHGDLLFAITGESVEDIGKTIAYLGKEKCLCGGDIICMKHKQNAKFLSYALSTPDAIRQKGVGKTKLKVVHTNAPALKAISVPVPALSVQHQIVTRLDALSARIKQLEEVQRKTLVECDALKQAMLREVFE